MAADMATWFITGTSSGFGRHLAELLLERGGRVAATTRKIGALDDLGRRYGDRLWKAALDVTDTAEVKRVVGRAFEDLGRIDVVVSNAGYNLVGGAEEVSDEQFMHLLATNLIGSIQVARAALPRLRAQGGGRILQLSSMSGQAAFPGGCYYAAGKWGIEGFFEALAAEVRPFNIQVTLIEPGSARTNIFHSGTVMGDKLAAYDNTPADLARRYVASGQVAQPGDPVKMASAMITCAEAPDAPLRLVLGKDAYTCIRAALTGRMAALEEQKELACSTDFDSDVS